MTKNTPVSSAAYRRSHYKASAVLLAALAAAGLVSTASAAQRTWSGAQNNGLMTDAGNWDAIPIGNQDAIQFNSTVGSVTNLTLNTSIQYTAAGLPGGTGAIQFNAGAPSLTIGGTGTITFGTGAIINNSGVQQTINNNLIRNSGNSITIGANNGSLLFGGNISMGGSGGTLATAFGTTTGGSITFSGNFTTGTAAGNLTLNGGAGNGTVNINGSANTGLNGTLTIGQNVTANIGSSTGLASTPTVLMNAAGAALANTSGSALSTNASLALNSSGQNYAFGAAGHTSSNNITFNGTNAITADLNRTITVNGTGVTVSSASVWNNSSVNSRTLTVNGSGNTFQIGGIAIGASGETVNRNFTVAGDGNLRVSGGITNGLGTGLRALSLTGSGTVTVDGASDWSNTTTIGSSATLLINGTHTGGRAYTVNGTLGGTGSIDTSSGNFGITVNNGGKLSASSLDSLAFSTGTGAFNVSAALGAASPSMLFTLGAPGSSVISIAGTGGLNIGSGVLEFNDFTFATGTGFGLGVYNLFELTSVSAAITGSLGSNLTGAVGGLLGTISTSGNDVILTVAAIPEPSAFAALAGLGALGVVASRRRRRA